MRERVERSDGGFENFESGGREKPVKTGLMMSGVRSHGRASFCTGVQTGRKKRPKLLYRAHGRAYYCSVVLPVARSCELMLGRADLPKEMAKLSVSMARSSEQRLGRVTC